MALVTPSLAAGVGPHAVGPTQVEFFRRVQAFFGALHLGRGQQRPTAAQLLLTIEGQAPFAVRALRGIDHIVHLAHRISQAGTGNGPVAPLVSPVATQTGVEHIQPVAVGLWAGTALAGELLVVIGQGGIEVAVQAAQQRVIGGQAPSLRVALTRLVGGFRAVVHVAGLGAHAPALRPCWQVVGQAHILALAVFAALRFEQCGRHLVTLLRGAVQ